MQTMSQDRKELAIRPSLDSAQAEGNLSAGTRRLLESPTVMRAMALAGGLPADQMRGDRILLVTILADDSDSLNVKKDHLGRIIGALPKDPQSNAEAIRMGQRTVIDALRNSPDPAAVHISTQGFNSGVIQPYAPLSEAITLSTENFLAAGGTPLHSRSLEVFGTVLVKSQEITDEWKTVNTATLIMSDGGNNDRESAQNVAKVVTDLRATGKHLVAAYGINDGYTDFVRVFTEMGIDPKWILTSESSQRDIQKALGAFADVASKATDEQQFTRLMLGPGFQGLAKQ